MMSSNSTRRAATSVTGALLIALGAAAFAANPPSAGPTPTKAMREKMAACLRSDKSLSDCRAQMQKSCHDMMGNQGCSMMMGMGGRKGMGQRMHGHMMSNPPSSSSAPK